MFVHGSYGASYYVNDSSTNGDVYVTAVGDDLNDGLTVATPKRTITNLLASVSLSAGDEVFIDTGSYTNSGLTLSTNGTALMPIVFQGSTNLPPHITEITFTGNPSGGITLNNADYNHLKHLRLNGGQRAVYAKGSDFALISHVDAVNQTVVGFQFGGPGQADSTQGRLENVLVSGGPKGVFTWNISGVRIENATLWASTIGVEAGGLSTTRISNSLVRVTGINNAAYSGTVLGNYNFFHMQSEAVIKSGFPNLSDFQFGSGQELHSSAGDPLLADTGAGNFYPRSAFGRFVSGGSFTNDGVTSPLIDNASPLSAVGLETAENGTRRNIGRYGATAQASRSTTGVYLRVRSFGDGGTLAPTSTLSWVAGPTSVSNETVQLDYSPDNGVTWTTLVTGVEATNEIWTWNNTAANQPSPEGRWRVTLESDTNVVSQSASRFTLRSPTGFVFYVNNGATTGDEYTTAVGSSGNSGLSSNTPLNSLQEVFSRYDLNGGDLVLVDAGSYSITQAVRITNFDTSGTNPLVVRGVSNKLAFVSSFANTVDGGITVENANPVHLRDFSMIGGIRGVNLFGTTNSRLSGLNFSGQSLHAVQLGSAGKPASPDTIIENTVISSLGAGAVPIESFGSPRVQVRNATIWTDRGIFASLGGSVSVSNSIVRVSGAANMPVDGVYNGGDYNIFVLESGATPFGVDNMSEHQKATSKDLRSVVLAATNITSAAVNYRPFSTVGRWNGAAYVTDTVQSRAIDFGNPALSVGVEGAPNGGRRNIGAFGGTFEASLSDTNRSLFALSYNDGGTLTPPLDAIYWNALNFSTSDTVRIEYSLNSGGSWSIVETNISANAGMYIWTSTNEPSSRFARYRVVYESNTNVMDATDQDFVFRNGPFSYYINDASLVGDVYTSVAGNDANLGIATNEPKATLNGLLAAHDVEPGDIIFVDTGDYLLFANQVIGALDGGDTNAVVLLQGSTNELAGGTVFRRNSQLSSAIALDVQAEHVRIRNMNFRNSGIGLKLSGAHSFRGEQIQVSGNAFTGLDISTTTNASLDQVAVYGNQGAGVDVRVSGSTRFNRLVSWSNTLAGVRSLEAGIVTVSNSAIVAIGDNAYGYRAATTNSIVGNYNAFYAAENGLVGRIQSLGRNLDTRSSWSAVTGRETLSIEGDPLFQNPAAGDFHLKTQVVNGRFVTGSGYVGTDSKTSPLIDAGDPSTGVGSEPAFNGSRRNIGYYGGTAEASKGLSAARLRVQSYVQGGWAKGLASFHWLAQNIATTETVLIELSIDGGANWSALTSGVPASAEIFTWNTAATNDTPAALWRVTLDGNPGITAATTNFFSIRNSNLQLYVNDSSLANDVYTTAAGGAANWRALSNAPLSSLSVLMNRVDLEPGDKVFVDTGVYTNSSAVSFSRADSGSTSQVVEVEGAAPGSSGTALTRLGGAGNVFVISARDVSVSKLTVENSTLGLMVSNTQDVVVNQVHTYDHASDGILITGSSNVFLSQVLSAENIGEGLDSQSSYVDVRQSVFWSNGVQSVSIQSGAVTAENNVFTSFGSGAPALNISGTPNLDFDFNHFQIAEGSLVARQAPDNFPSLIDWQLVEGNDLNSFSGLAGFADPGARDFHPQTTVPLGRFVPGSGYVTNDVVDSPLIDTGTPSSPFVNEPSPNGNRVNKGLHGNTSEASLSRTNGWFLALTLSDGGTVSGTNVLNWVAGGTATGHTVRIELSLDNGVTWSNVQTGIAAGSSEYIWDTTSVFVNFDSLWRVVSEVDTNIVDETDSDFIINNGPITYYVNDASTVDDVFTSAPGSIVNTGTSPGSPKASIQQILDAFSLRPFDEILVDTGTYVPASTITFSGIHAQETNRFLISGVPGGGTEFSSRGFLFQDSGAIHLRDVTLNNVNTAVSILNSSNTLLESVNVFNSPTGVEVNNSDGVKINNGIISGSSLRAIYHFSDSDNTEVRNMVLWDNDRAIWQTASGGSLSIEDSVIEVDGANRYAYYQEFGTLTADYNSIRLQSGGRVAWIDTITVDTFYENVSRWAALTGRDVHSLRQEDPQFFNPPENDFHLQSHGGRYSNGVFVLDTVTSPLIDAGSITNGVGAETLPNGGRGNIGAYGRTLEASRTSSSTGQFVIISYNDGGIAQKTNETLYWNAQGSMTNVLANIEFSPDAGDNWILLTNSIPATNGFYIWDTTSFTSTVRALWRIREVAGPGIDTSDELFSFRNIAQSNGQFRFYVNDSSTNLDIYSSSAGASTNFGDLPSRPMSSIQLVLDTYEVLPGDTIFVDSGVYSQTQSTIVGVFDRGSATNPVRIVGSTNDVVGRSVIDGSGLEFNSTFGYAVQNLVITNADAGLSFSDFTSDISFSKVEVWNSASGATLINSDRISFTNSVIAQNASWGIFAGNNSDDARWIHGVLWNNQLGVSLSGSSLTLENSLIGEEDNGAYGIQYDGTGLTSDYNSFHITGPARVAQRTDINQLPIVDYLSVSRWRRDEGKDEHSLSMDPLLNDVASGDFHVLSKVGRYDPLTGLFTADGSTSPLIDAGNPANGVGNETSPNGNRVNIGLFGSTDEASRSPTVVTDSILTAVTASDGGRIEGVIDLVWSAAGPVTGHTALIEYSADSGSTWTTIVAGVSVSAGTYSWNSDQPAFQSSVLGVWRITSDTAPTVTDQTDDLFALRNDPLSFYVNDDSVDNDQYTTAVGNNANFGVASNAPKRDIQAIITAHDLEAGDTVWIDSGTYAEAVLIDVFDSGESGNPVTFIGATSDAGTTMIDAQSASRAIELISAPYMAFKHLSISNASTGIRISDSDSVAVEWLRALDLSTGVDILSSSGTQLDHVLITDSSVGINIGSSVSGTRIAHSVLWSNTIGVKAISSGTTISNSVIAAFGSNRKAYELQFASQITSDYNNFWLQTNALSVTLNGPNPDINLATVSRWARDYGQDVHSLTHDPKFANVLSQDFHIVSREGRYSNGVFVVDGDTSPLIDAADPSGDVSPETSPNGARVNIGLYGATAQASRTPTLTADSVLTAITANDGGRLENTIDLQWVVTGPATGHTVRLDYSSDGGDSWALIDTNVNASAGSYLWNSLTYTSSIQGVWRLVSEVDTNLFDETDKLFALRNDPISFYVNDASQAGDIYTLAPGAATNSGLVIASPMNSLQSLLTKYDLEPGDTVFVDSGTYNLTAPINFVEFDNGTAESPVLIQGSTDDVNRTIYNRTSGVLFNLDTVEGLRFNDLTIQFAGTGVKALSSKDLSFYNLRFRDLTTAVDINASTDLSFNNCLIDGCELGLLSSGGSDTEWLSGVLWDNMIGMELRGGLLTVNNTSFNVDGAENVALFQSGGTLVSDYNHYDINNGAFLAYTLGGSLGGGTQRFESVGMWATTSELGQDKHSLSGDPRFEDPGNGDFHPRTSMGQYLPGVGLVTNPASDVSQLIDAGNPASLFDDESDPNGGRRNIGIFGGTEQASQSPTSGVVFVVSLKDGGSVKGQHDLLWTALGAASDDTLDIDISLDNGVNWTNIASVAASAGTYTWNSTSFGTTPLAKWRITSQEDSLITDESDQFALRNGILTFYVNDSSTIDDQYTTDIGKGSADGATPATPMNSIQQIFDTYNLEPGDLILVDVGTYLLLDDIRIGGLDAGEETNRVVVQGATSCLSAGTVVDRQVGSGTTAGFRFEFTGGIEVKDMTVKNAGSGALLYDQSPGCAATGVILEDNINGVNLHRSGTFTLRNSVLRDNSSAGVTVSQSSIDARHCVIMDNPTALNFVTTGGATMLRNNHLAVTSGRIYNLGIAAGFPDSDYNNIYRIGGGLVGVKASLIGAPDAFPTLTEWHVATGVDVHSLSHDPKFFDEGSGDFHLLSEAGRTSCAGTVMDIESSVLIDAGEPGNDAGLEPLPNGNRVNIGLYGGTTEASVTPTNPTFTAVSFNDGGVLDAVTYTNVILYWTHFGFTNGAMANIDYSINDGVSWINIDTVPVTNSFIQWDLSSVPDTLLARWRVISQTDTNLFDWNDEAFNIRRVALEIYVNDGSTSNDIYTTAIGDPDNPGTPSAPFDSLATVLDKFTLLSGDRVWIDTGIYTNSSDIGLTAVNKGTISAPIQIIGSTETAAGGSLHHRTGTNTGRFGFTLDETEYVELKHLRFSGASTGVKISNSENILLSHVETFGNTDEGFFANQVRPMQFSRSVAWSNGTFGLRVNNNLSQIYWDHGVLWGNASGSVEVVAGLLELSNSLFHAATTSGVAYLRGGEQAVLFGNYNGFWLESGAKLGRDVFLEESYPVLEDWQSLTGGESQSFVQNPLFADPEGGDFHLQSEAGRYDPATDTFVLDPQTSWAIDAGTLGAPFTNETANNGSRVNAGLYGNTPEASRSVTNQQDFLITVLDTAGNVDGSKQLYWLSRGFSTSDTLRIEFSTDAGATWDTVITSNQTIISDGYFWVPCADTNTPSSPVSLFRLVYETDTNVLTAATVPFLIRCGPISYYVNDLDTAGDVYTLVPGSSTNVGTSAATPKSRVEEIITSFDLEAGDIVHIDTGVYEVDNHILIGQTDGGDDTGFVSFIGNTNNAVNTTVIRATTNFTGTGIIYLNSVEAIRLSHLTLEGGSRGLNLNRALNTEFESLLLKDNLTGAGVSLSSSNDFNRVIISRAQTPIDMSQSSLTFHNGIIWGNTGSAIKLSISSASVSNSILYASGVGNRVFNDVGSIAESFVDSDYNNLRFVNGAVPANDIFTGDYENIPQWFLATDNGIHSVNLDPQFVDPTNDVYFLKSEQGRHSPLATSNHPHFGDVDIGTSVTSVFTIANSGSAPILLTGVPLVNISGPASNDFSVGTLPAASIAPGTNTSFSIIFTPGSNVLRKAVLTIDNNDADEKNYQINVSGQGVTP